MVSSPVLTFAVDLPVAVPDPLVVVVVVVVVVGFLLLEGVGDGHRACGILLRYGYAALAVHAVSKGRIIADRIAVSVGLEYVEVAVPVYRAARPDTVTVSF